ncbi:hypothetical protein [uncultured Maribacter sp.]|uniref:hypothetical protein n=1 Tax=uncultured Maribacter sp. TaxID=431308 RepID=UPI0030D7ADEB
MKYKIVYPIVTIILIASLLGPYFVKIYHALNEHKEFHCTSKKLHIHAIEFDCDFEHYQLSSLYYPEFEYPKFIELAPITEAIINNYYFLSKYQQLHFVLRGPPSC